MRNTYTIVLLATPLLLAAQQGEMQAPALYHKLPLTAGSAHHSSIGTGERSDATALWSEDFENGLNGWTVETAHGSVDWALTSTGNTAGFTPGPLESTTGYPTGQWIVADSDAEGTDGVSENSSITSPAILGLDTVPYMLLQFEQSFRQLNDDQTLVEVSGNGGTDWTAYPVNEDIGGNQSTPGTPASQVITINITSALSQGSGDVRIRFRWMSDQGFTYSWQVDDIALLTVRPNDLALLDATYAAWDLDEIWYDGMPCTMYPLGETHPLRFKGLIGNNGSAPQTDVHLSVEITGPGGYDITLLSPSITLEPGTMDSLFITDYELPDVVGDYVFNMIAVQNEVEDGPDDNATEQGARVDANLFARDEGHVESVRANNGSDYELGNRFWLTENGRMAEAVDVALGPGTEAGAVISATVYDGTFNFIQESDLHVVTQAEINDFGGNTFITLPLLAATELDAERLYLVCIYAQTSEGEVFTGISGNSLPQTSMIYRYETGNWYYTTSTPMVRMRLDDYVGIDTPMPSCSGLRAFPSPFDERATVIFNSAQGGEARWELRDATGRLARAGNMGTLSPGEHRIAVDGEGLEAGVYTMTVGTGGVRSTVKLVRQARR
jgi:hypothetical protein